MAKKSASILVIRNLSRELNTALKSYKVKREIKTNSAAGEAMLMDYARMEINNERMRNQMQDMSNEISELRQIIEEYITKQRQISDLEAEMVKIITTK